MSPEQVQALVARALEENRVELMTIHERSSQLLQTIAHDVISELRHVERPIALEADAEAWRRIAAIALHAAHLTSLQAQELRSKEGT